MDAKEDYNDEPVFYCKRCLSLKIEQIPYMVDQCFCGECGATAIESTDIESWKSLYRKKYKRDYVEKKELKWPYWC